MPGTKLAEQKHRRHLQGLAHPRAPGAEPAEPRPAVTLEPARGALVAAAERRRGAPGVRGAPHARGRDGAPRCARASRRRRSPSCARTCAIEREPRCSAPTCAGRTRLLADFHVVLARMLGNEVLAQHARRPALALLADRADVPVGAFGRALADEHVAIVDALERRDARAAVRLMESTSSTSSATCASIRARTTSTSGAAAVHRRPRTP